MTCYYCGKEIHEKDQTKEHIPAKNLYEGLDEAFKKNLITVPAHRECNGNYSKIDQHIRDMVGISNESLIVKQDLSMKAVRSIFRSPNWKSRLKFDNHGSVYGISFNKDELDGFHKKNFKGLFFHENRYPLPSDFEIEVLFSDGEEANDTIIEFYNFLIQGTDWKCSGHKDIFRYLLRNFKFENDILIPVNELEDADMIGVAMFYHNDKGAILLADKVRYFEKFKSNNKQLTTIN